MGIYPKRLIEVDLPIKRISAHARREKGIHHGHISMLHIWWARRPLAACRAVICASLWPDPADDICPDMFRKVAREQMTKWAKNHLNLLSEESWSRFMAISKDERKLDDLVELRAAMLDFIADFANWDNSKVPEYLETSRVLTQAAHEALGGEPGSRPLVIEPFSGGGAIPFEASRVGSDVFATDINPVAVLLNEIVLEHIPRFGKTLADSVKHLGAKLIGEASKELLDFYPNDDDGMIPIAYIWARTAQCEGPNCGAEVPLVRSTWLSKKATKRISMRIRPDTKSRSIAIEICENLTHPSEGTVRRGALVCPVCHYVTPAKNVRRQFFKKRGGADQARLLIVVRIHPQKSGRYYRIANRNDYRIIENAIERRKQIEEQYVSGLPIFPNEELPYLRSIFNINLLGVSKWRDLFSSRQLLVISTVARLISEMSLDDINSNPDLALATKECLGLVLDKLADGNSTLVRWQPTGEGISNTFGRQALPIVWDFCETNPFCGAARSLKSMVAWIVDTIESASYDGQIICNTGIASATKHPLPNDSADSLITDPPYYDAVPYADLSDFFYVWLRRALPEKRGDLFANPLTAKEDEIVQLAERNPLYSYKTRENYEALMKSAMSEARRVVRPSGIGVVFFAHKDTSAWESQLQAMIDSGWHITASWPIDSEKQNRLRAMDSATLSSTVHLVVRPRENPDGSIRTDDVGDWRNVLAELPKRIHEWMPRLAEEGVVGADAIFACLGPALEIYSRYSSVEKASGEQVELSEYLEEVWAAVSREALNMIFEGADASGFEEDARLTAMWLWTLRTAVNGGNGIDENGAPTKSLPGYTLEYDAARKIAQGLGAHLENLSHLVEIKGNTAMLLSAAARTNYLFGKDAAKAPKGKRKKKIHQPQLFDIAENLKQIEEESDDWVGELSGKAGSTVLDQLHQSMILFAAGRGEAMKQFLVEEGVGRNPLFWRLAQALSALYPAGTDEKRWVDGVLARKKGLSL